MCWDSSLHPKICNSPFLHFTAGLQFWHFAQKVELLKLHCVYLIIIYIAHTSHCLSECMSIIQYLTQMRTSAMKSKVEISLSLFLQPGCNFSDSPRVREEFTAGLQFLISSHMWGINFQIATHAANLLQGCNFQFPRICGESIFKSPHMRRIYCRVAIFNFLTYVGKVTSMIIRTYDLTIWFSHELFDWGFIDIDQSFYYLSWII